jgi:hypothetical protein
MPSYTKPSLKPRLTFPSPESKPGFEAIQSHKIKINTQIIKHKMFVSTWHVADHYDEPIELK